MPRKPIALVLGLIFGVLAIMDLVQVLLALLGRSDELPTLIALHFGTGVAAAATAWGSWRRTRWTPIAAVAYGVLATALLLWLPSLVNLPAEARAGIRGGAVAVLLFAVVSAVYFRAYVRQSSPRVPAEQANER